jgi:ubiquinone/menaquinone biosynthesis C-methylase UbiE
MDSMTKEKSFKKVKSFNDILLEYLYFPRMVVIDVGCGTGDLVRWLTLQGANVTGVDLEELIEKAKKIERAGDEKYVIGTGQELSFKVNSADLILYFASFHHIPENEMKNALERCYRILKPEGHTVFIEPVARKDSYYILTRLIEDEVDIQKKAFDFVKNAPKEKFQQIVESFYYTERSFQDFLNLISIYVPDDNQREVITQQAMEIVKKRDEPIEQVRFRSFVRLNILQKKAL